MMAKSKTLKVCHVNVRSMVTTGHLVELNILSSVNDIDILCVAETWLSQERIKEGASMINIPGFLPLFRRDRTKKRGGGVAVFVRFGLIVSPLQLCSDLEAVGIELHLPKKRKLNIISDYCAPSGNLEELSSFISNLDTVLTNLKPSSNITCLVGDFNARLSH